MPLVFRSMDIDINENFIESINKLYGHQPLFYQGLLSLGRSNLRKYRHPSKPKFYLLFVLQIQDRV
jgi:hypothetical protein